MVYFVIYIGMAFAAGLAWYWFATGAGLVGLGVAVLIEAEHLCMTMRGIRAAGAKTQTSALRGRFRSDARSRAEVMALLQ